MRRRLGEQATSKAAFLVLLSLAVCPAQESAPASQQEATASAPRGQHIREQMAPPVVKVEMPPENAATHIIDVLLQGGSGAAFALFGVWLTNKNNRQTNEANHAHEENRWQQQRQWELKRDLLIRVAQSFVLTHEAAIKWCEMDRWVEHTESRGAEIERGEKEKAARARLEAADRLNEILPQMAQATAAVALCASQKTLDAIQECQRMLSSAHIQLRNSRGTGQIIASREQSQRILEVLRLARADLGVTESGAQTTNGRGPNGVEQGL